MQFRMWMFSESAYSATNDIDKLAAEADRAETERTTASVLVRELN